MRHNSSTEAIARGSPGDCKSHAGKYGELPPLRQRGGGGLTASLLPATDLIATMSRDAQLAQGPSQSVAQRFLRTTAISS